MLGLGPGDEHGGRNDEIHSPEFLMSRDVLGGNAAGTLGQSVVVAELLLRGKLAFGVSIKISTVTIQNEHEQRLGIQARRGNLLRGEVNDGGTESFAERHSPD
jgi:hypothetical protein